MVQVRLSSAIKWQMLILGIPDPGTADEECIALVNRILTVIRESPLNEMSKIAAVGMVEAVLFGDELEWDPKMISRYIKDGAQVISKASFAAALTAKIEGLI